MDSVQASFLARLESAIVIGDEHYQIDFPAVLQLVADAPHLAARVISESLRNAADVPRLFRIAEVLAFAYQAVEQDDAFQRAVEARGRELGREPATLGIERDGGTVSMTFPELLALESPAQQKPIFELAVSPAQLRALEIYPLIRRFSSAGRSPSDLQKLKELRGSFRLSFMLRDDPRDVVFIPEVRRFVAKLFDALPFLPYYLDLSEESGSVSLLLGCLVDSEAVVPQPGGGWGINLADASVARFFAEALLAIAVLASELEDDPTPVWSQLMSGLPAETQMQILAAVGSA